MPSGMLHERPPKKRVYGSAPALDRTTSLLGDSIAFGKAPRRERYNTRVSQLGCQSVSQSVIQSVNQSVSQVVKQAGR